MNKKLIYTASIVASTAMLVSCNDFLDELPDNRAELNTEEKIKSLLISAYPTHDAIIFGEYMSDNLDDTGENNPNTERFYDQVFHWEDVTETDNSDPESYWNDLNSRVEAANTALEAIEKMDSKSSAMMAARAEALLCRAYATFMMVNYFSLQYDPKNSTALGVSSIREPETELNPKYERVTVHQNYKEIQADIEEALPIVSDEYYVAPKYHFNQNAAYAFACRFYLFSEQWDKAIECANRVLGSNPKSMLRDWATMSHMTSDFPAISQHYIDATVNANLLLLTSYSAAGLTFGPYYVGKRYSHTEYVGTNETIDALAGLWGGDYTSFYFQIKRYSGTNLNTWVKWSMPYLFEYTDPVAGIGYYHTVYNAFTGDEILLNRAEAYILKGMYDKAAADLTIWMQNVSQTAAQKNLVLTPASIKAYFDKIEYSYEDKDKMKSSIKKHLNPKFAIEEEGSIQESMLQCVLAMRRFETLHEGKRWFDIKRYGIVIPRRIMDADGKPSKVTDWLSVDDPRRAVQIPKKSVDAGYTPNPR